MRWYCHVPEPPTCHAVGLAHGVQRKRVRVCAGRAAGRVVLRVLEREILVRLIADVVDVVFSAERVDVTQECRRIDDARGIVRGDRDNGPRLWCDGTGQRVQFRCQSAGRRGR